MRIDRANGNGSGFGYLSVVAGRGDVRLRYIQLPEMFKKYTVWEKDVLRKEKKVLLSSFQENLIKRGNQRTRFRVIMIASKKRNRQQSMDWLPFLMQKHFNKLREIE